MMIVFGGVYLGPPFMETTMCSGSSRKVPGIKREFTREYRYNTSGYVVILG